MIELTYKPHPTNSLHHNVTAWVNGNPILTKMLTMHELKQLSDSMHNESLALNGYIFRSEK